MNHQDTSCQFITMHVFGNELPIVIPELLCFFVLSLQRLQYKNVKIRILLLLKKVQGLLCRMNRPVLQ